VAVELERRWSRRCGGERTLQEQYDRFLRERPRELTTAIGPDPVTASDLAPAAGERETTTAADRQISSGSWCNRSLSRPME